MAKKPRTYRRHVEEVLGSGRVAERLQNCVAPVEGRVDVLEEQGLDQAAKIGEHGTEINTLTAQNLDQATKINELRRELGHLHDERLRHRPGPDHG